MGTIVDVLPVERRDPFFIDGSIVTRGRGPRKVGDSDEEGVWVR